MMKTEARTLPPPPAVPPGCVLCTQHTDIHSGGNSGLVGSSQVSFPEGLSSAAEAEVWGEPLTAGTRMHPTVPGNKADPVPAHLLLQTDAELLGGQRGPRWGRLGGRGQPAGVQVPKLLVISVDTTEAQLSASRGAASGPKVLLGHMPHKHLHPF